MNKATLLALAERVESAQAEQQAALFEEAVRALSDARLISAACAVRCAILIDVRAFLDAAAALVPEGLYWTAGYGRMRPDEPLGGAIITRPFRDRPPVAEGEAATPALALTTAALRARAAMMED